MKKFLVSAVLLSLSSAAMADLSDSCKTYFEKVDKLVESLPKDAATKQQTDMMKQNLEAGKKQVAAMSSSDQETGCKQGLEALKQLESVYPALK